MTKYTTKNHQPYENPKQKRRRRKKSEASRINSQIMEALAKIVIENPIEEYFDARKLTRHFILHIGLTNTGKTYSSLERLKETNNGIYLSPLRLLALEVQERFLSEGILCSMLTGEEEDWIENAPLVSCTVEKADIHKEYEIAVVDECQMLRDPDRGWAWTRAILGLICPEIHLCMAPEAEVITIGLIKACGDTYEVVRHERNTELVVEPEPFSLSNDVQKGDALIVFSKRQVIGLAGRLEQLGHKCAVIYGALPYRSRKEQVRLFVDGLCDVVVATDAIGMGMNLPIRRIVFMQEFKYDGKSERPLEEYEVKQIAGRAGRRGIYDEGFVISADASGLIPRRLAQKPEPLTRIQLGVPDMIVDMDFPLDKILSMWNEYPTGNELFFRKNMNREIKLFDKIREIPMTNREYYECVNIPFDEKNEFLLDYWCFCCRKYFLEELDIHFPKYRSYYEQRLDSLETYYKILDLYYQFCKRFEIEIDMSRLMNKKVEIADQICRVLEKKPKKTCKICGKPLAWDCRFAICDDCYFRPEELPPEEYGSWFRIKKKY